MTSHTSELRDLANEIALTRPDLGRRLHAVANQVHTMEEAIDNLVRIGASEAWRQTIEAQGVVALPTGVWGRG